MVKAEQHLSEGRRLYEQGFTNYEQETTNFNNAIKEYEIALKIWRELREKYWEAMTLYNLGLIYNTLSKNEQAIDYHSQTVTTFLETKDLSKQQRRFSPCGNSYNAKKDYNKAPEHFDKTLKFDNN